MQRQAVQEAPSVDNFIPSDEECRRDLRCEKMKPVRASDIVVNLPVSEDNKRLRGSSPEGFHKQVTGAQGAARWGSSMSKSQEATADPQTTSQYPQGSGVGSDPVESHGRSDKPPQEEAPHLRASTIKGIQNILASEVAPGSVRVPRVVLIGPCGHGKSRLVQKIAGVGSLESMSSTSATAHSSSCRSACGRLEVIDTPGRDSLGETVDDTMTSRIELASALSEGSVTMILFVVKAETRIPSLVTQVGTLSNEFTGNGFKHWSLCDTHGQGHMECR